MDRVLITGATGTVGNAVARALVEQGRSVRALVRSSERARDLLPREVELAPGDVTSPESVYAATRDCDVVYHIAGLPEQWLADESRFQSVNVEGTRNLVDAALKLGVKNFIYTSTIDVFEFNRGVPFDETKLDPKPKPTAYERSKQEADRIVAGALDKGLPARFIHPSGVYGPAPALTPPLNTFVCDIAMGKVPMLLPGGFPVVYAPDLAQGHLLAEAKGSVGGRYILSEAFYTMEEFLIACRASLPQIKIPPTMPFWVASLVASAGEALARMTKKPPLIAKGQLHFLSMEVRPSAERARTELGWSPVSLAEGLAATIEDFARRGWIKIE